MVRGVFEAIGIKYRSAGRLPPSAAPLSRFAGLLLKGSVSLDSQSPQAPYESSSFATPQAGAEQPVLKLEQLMSSQPRKALLCPFRGKVVAPATKGGSPPQAAYILIAARRYLHPLNLLNPLHLLNPFL